MLQRTEGYARVNVHLDRYRLGYVFGIELGRARDRENDDGARRLLAVTGLAGVVINAHVQIRGVDTLEVPIEHILQVIQIVMLSAGRVVVGEGSGETLVPSIVLSHGGGEISIVTIQDSLEILGSDADIRHGVIAVASVTGAFL